MDSQRNLTALRGDLTAAPPMQAAPERGLMGVAREARGTRRCCDAAMMAVGLASTALPFAHSHAEEVERWLRILRVSGAVGTAMQAIGMPEEAFTSSAGPTTDVRLDDPLEAVLVAADGRVRERRTDAIDTVDLFHGVKAAYGPALDHALAVRGTSFAEVVERLDSRYGSI
jgi:hypothetical protein